MSRLGFTKHPLQLASIPPVGLQEGLPAEVRKKGSIFVLRFPKDPFQPPFTKPGFCLPCLPKG